jgi:hypothetical protein
MGYNSVKNTFYEKNLKYDQHIFKVFEFTQLSYQDKISIDVVSKETCDYFELKV